MFCRAGAALTPRHAKATSQRVSEAALDNQDVQTATQHLMTHVVQAVCAALRAPGTRRERVSVVHAFHQEGLNMRYIGLVYDALVQQYKQTEQPIYTAVLAEALMRVFKSHLRACLRRAQGESRREVCRCAH